MGILAVSLKDLKELGVDQEGGAEEGGTPPNFPTVRVQHSTIRRQVCGVAVPHVLARATRTGFPATAATISASGGRRTEFPSDEMN
eukprot:8060213-Pyramimonas_sp.AAC.1